MTDDCRRRGTKGHLECVYVAKAILYMAVDDELGQPKNLPTQVKSVAEPRLLALLCRQGLHRHQNMPSAVNDSGRVRISQRPDVTCHVSNTYIHWWHFSEN